MLHHNRVKSIRSEEGTLYKLQICLNATHGSGGLTAALANVLIFSRTTEIPRSSEALSSKTLFRMSSGPKSSLQRARIVDVLPVPGGP